MFQYRYAQVIVCSVEEVIFLSWVLLFSIATCYNVNIKQLFSSSMYKYNS